MSIVYEKRNEIKQRVKRRPPERLPGSLGVYTVPRSIAPMVSHLSLHINDDVVVMIT
jgi:hypothetical protein